MKQELITGQTEQKNKFIDLRARGYSYSKIAVELKVSKATLTLWQDEFRSELGKLRALQLDELYTKYFMLKEHRIAQLGGTLNSLNAELEKRDLTSLSTDKLLDFKIKYMKELKEEYIEPQEDKSMTKLNATSILAEQLRLLVRFRNGELTKDQAYSENQIITGILKTHETHTMEEKLNNLETIVKKSQNI